ncbi:NUDIX domain-containing protein [Gracilibacillus caseinilyticus]|uniref:NUDIX domain-containing protein n=1 Tax=Gracilibacillus caseinilyticus TaxID=2932256 RepID=A0ABY4F1K3_9BACI|nr:NUDIX domain-containing protein [Gracilibacillus caseinilyticus]UOQ49769.1 NUDIX domain-containing protein [Gracilibacillus caseinilyticus]
MKQPFHHLARGVLAKENKVLVAHALGQKNTFLPGGHIEFGESAMDALIREVREELGVNL